MAFILGIIDPSKRQKGLCGIPECQDPIAGKIMATGSREWHLCQKHLDELNEREVQRVQEQ